MEKLLPRRHEPILRLTRKLAHGAPANRLLDPMHRARVGAGGAGTSSTRHVEGCSGTGDVVSITVSRGLRYSPGSAVGGPAVPSGTGAARWASGGSASGLVSSDINATPLLTAGVADDSPCTAYMAAITQNT